MLPSLYLDAECFVLCPDEAIRCDGCSRWERLPGHKVGICSQNSGNQREYDGPANAECRTPEDDWCNLIELSEAGKEFALEVLRDAAWENYPEDDLAAASRTLHDPFAATSGRLPRDTTVTESRR